MIYWVREIRMMANSEDQRMMARDTDQIDWVYDLIMNNDGMVFFAVVPGPEDQISVRLADSLLRIKGGQNFSKDIPLEFAQDMGISDYKYRNGVLTIKIRRI